MSDQTAARPPASEPSTTTPITLDDEEIGRSMGIELTELTGLTRARIALTTWRLVND